jgi:hypothetical protein
MFLFFYVLQIVVALSCSENKPTFNRYDETYRDGVWDGGEGIQKFTNGDTLEGVFNSTCSGEFTYTFYNGGKYVPTEVPPPVINPTLYSLSDTMHCCTYTHTHTVIHNH